MKFFKWFFAIIFILPINAWAEDGAKHQMDLGQVVLQTYKTNASIQAGRNAVGAVSEELPQAWSGALPTISTGVAYNYQDVDGSPDSFASTDFDSAVDFDNTQQNWSVSVAQPLYTGGSTLSNIRRAKADIDESIYEQLALEQTIILSAIESYLDLFRDRALLDLAKNNYEVIKRQFDASESRYEYGELTLTDVSQARARLAEAQSELISAGGNLEVTKARFSQITQLPSDIELVFPEVNQGMIPLALDQAVDVALKENPSLLASIKAEKAAKHSTRSALGELLPQMSIQSDLSKTYDPHPGSLDDQETLAVTLNASLSLYQGGNTRSRIRQSRYREQQAQYNIDDIRRNVRESVISNWQAFVTARSEQDTRQVQVDAAKIARDGVYQEESVGARTILDSLDADQEYLDAQVALVIAERDKVQAAYALISAMGRLNLTLFNGHADSFNYERLTNKSILNQLSTSIDLVE